MALPIIYINSWPGVGKHTIARELEKHMKGRLRVVRNHLHIDLADAILPRTSSDYLELRQKLRSTIFDSLVTSSDTFDYYYAFTDFQTANEVGSGVATEYAEAARRRDSAFIPIILTCEEAENRRRIESPQRLSLEQGGLGILVDPDVLIGFRERSEIYRFRCPEELVLDITEISPVEAVEKIVEHLEHVTRRSKVAE